jgi:hypothetical protein
MTAESSLLSRTDSLGLSRTDSLGGMRLTRRHEPNRTARKRRRGGCAERKIDLLPNCEDCRSTASNASPVSLSDSCHDCPSRTAWSRRVDDGDERVGGFESCHHHRGGHRDHGPVVNAPARREAQSTREGRCAGRPPPSVGRASPAESERVRRRLVRRPAAAAKPPGPPASWAAGFRRGSVSDLRRRSGTAWKATAAGAGWRCCPA